jgi:hypothetical protein
MDRYQWFKENNRILAFMFFIVFELAILFMLYSFGVDKIADGEKYGPLIDAGKKCIKQVDENPSGIIPMCEIKLRDILITGGTNTTIIGLPSIVIPTP